ncbi:MAG: hypothetical protein HFJ59_06400 [Clostridia bacterium]|nr:hypothetical protein [Clostridia bacterium]
MTETTILNKLNSAATEILDKTINECNVTYSLHMRKIACELKNCKDITRSGMHWKSENPIELQLKPKQINVETEEIEKKVRTAFEYINKLVEILNKVSSSMQFKLCSHFFIGRFVRNEGSFVFKISWKLKK